ncbi:AMP-binding protein, partial [Staphylococcus aureus]
TIFLTTGLFNVLVEQHLSDLGSVRHLLTGGDIASPRHMQAVLDGLPDCTLVHVYGPTEGTTFSTFGRLPRGAALPELVPI